jgi:signal transduction histidine kinase
MIGTERVSEIVQALREAAHPGTGQKVDSNISTILHNAAIVSRNSWKYHAELLEDYDESCPMVAVFVGELSQAFINLIVNAADAVQEEIERAAPESQAKGEIRLTSQLVDSFVEVRISDTGGGVSPEIRSKIFDYFFTTKAPGKGTGQGLAIAYDVIVNKHGGELSFDSVPQRGSTFIVRLPIHPL